MILIKSEFFLLTAVTKSYQYAQQDVQKIVGNSLRNTPSRIRRSEKNRQATEEETFPGEIELEN